MTNRSNALIPVALALLTLVLTLAGCASSPPASDQSASEPAPVQEIEPWDGDGMEIPLDGSSMEAWDRSMARVEAHTDEATFTTLQNAIDYLLTYDLSARKDMNRLIKNLDGGHPMLADCLRVTVGTSDENSALIAAFEQALRNVL